MLSRPAINADDLPKIHVIPPEPITTQDGNNAPAVQQDALPPSDSDSAANNATVDQRVADTPMDMDFEIEIRGPRRRAGSTDSTDSDSSYGAFVSTAKKEKID